MIYEKGKVYGEHIIHLPLVRITLATQRNVGGTFTKDVSLPWFRFIRDYRGAQLKLFGFTIFTTKTKHPGGE